MGKLEHYHGEVISQRKKFERDEYQQYINRSARVLFDNPSISISTTGKIEISDREAELIANLRNIASSMSDHPTMIPAGLEELTDLRISSTSNDRHNPEALVIAGILGSSIAEIAGTTFQVEKFKKLSQVVRRTLRAVESSDRERIMQGATAVSKEVDETEKYRNRMSSSEGDDKKGAGFINKMLSFGRGVVL